MFLDIIKQFLIVSVSLDLGYIIHVDSTYPKTVFSHFFWGIPKVWWFFTVIIITFIIIVLLAIAVLSPF